ncbi:hypothetical protein YC2023_104551 [Brassica napus]
MPQKICKEVLVVVLLLGCQFVCIDFTVIASIDGFSCVLVVLHAAVLLRTVANN